MTAALLALLMAMKPLLLDEAGPAVRLVVETSRVRESGAGPAIARQIRASGEAMLRATNVVGGASDQVVEVSVRTLRGAALGYQTTVALHRGGRRVAASRARCELCTEGEAVAAALRSLAGLAPKLRGPAHGA